MCSRSYLEELKEQQKQNEILLSATPQQPAPPDYQYSTYTNTAPPPTASRPVLKHMDSDVSAILPALSMTDSEFSTVQIPRTPLQHWDNGDVLQVLHH